MRVCCLLPEISILTLPNVVRRHRALALWLFARNTSTPVHMIILNSLKRHCLASCAGLSPSYISDTGPAFLDMVLYLLRTPYHERFSSSFIFGCEPSGAPF